MLAFGAKLGDSSSDPGDSVDQRGDPRLRSSNAIRYTLPLPCATEIFLSSYETVGLAVYLPWNGPRVALTPIADHWSTCGWPPDRKRSVYGKSGKVRLDLG